MFRILTWASLITGLYISISSILLAGSQDWYNFAIGVLMVTQAVFTIETLDPRPGAGAKRSGAKLSSATPRHHLQGFLFTKHEATKLDKLLNDRRSVKYEDIKGEK